MTTTVERVAPPADGIPPSGTAPSGANAAGPAAGAPPLQTAGGRRSAPAGRRKRRRLLAVFVLLAGALVYLLVAGLGSSLDYFDTVAQAVSHKQQIGTGVIRLEGIVVKGTVERTRGGARFDVSGGGHQIAVVNTGSPPELFQPTIPVVVVGHFTSAGSFLFRSNQILVKHSPTYAAAHPTRLKGSNGKVAP